MADNVIKSNEVTSFAFGDEVAPTGMDPNATERHAPPDGWHLFELVDFGFVPNKTFKGQDFGEWAGTQLRPQWKVAPDQPHAGDTMMDFLPMPGGGAPTMPTALANRWANFMRAIGLQLPAGKIIPPGFTIHHFITQPTRRAWARVVTETYEDKTGKEKTTIKIGFFAYHPITEPPDEAAKAKAAATTAPATVARPSYVATPAPPTATAGPQPVDLSEL